MKIINMIAYWILFFISFYICIYLSCSFFASDVNLRKIIFLSILLSSLFLLIFSLKKKTFKLTKS